MSIRTIAIIGCGAAGTTFFKSFIDASIRQQLHGIRVIILERNHALGPGCAYQQDFHQLLINRPAQFMSANPQNRHEYYEWLKQKRHLKNIADTGDTPIYTSRQLFGLYLNEMLEKTILRASIHHIHTSVVYENVTAVLGKNPYLIQTHTNKSIIADAVIFCSGHNLAQDHYKLAATPQYIHTPYPLQKSSAAISKHASVGIIGNSLTAIDIVIALKKLGITNKITLLSRRHVIPRVRGQIVTHQPTHLTLAAINKILQQNGKLTLRAVLRLFRKEMQHHHLAWQTLFQPDNDQPSFASSLTAELNRVTQIQPAQAIIPSINPVAELIWHHLSPRDKALFTRRCQRYWLNQRSSIPPINAQLLLTLAEENRLFYQSNLESITYCQQTKHYTARHSNGEHSTHDWIFNATGPSLQIKREDHLLYQLVRSGKARTHAFGGLDIDFDTAALIDKHGTINPLLRIIGHNTTGAYQYTSSLELIAKKSMQIAENLVTLIQEVHHASSKTATANTHSASYSA